MNFNFNVISLLVTLNFNYILGGVINFQGVNVNNYESAISSADSNADEQGEYFEGDMLFGPSTFSGQADPRYRWPNRQVIYKINPAFTQNEVSIIMKAMQEISAKTCITFKQQTTENAYVNIQRGAQGSGCNSYVGRIGSPQALNLAPTCITSGVIAHELVHAIGFRHEHSRTDRDSYIQINYDNIKPEFKYAFNKYGEDTVNSFGVEYDYGSIMHYSKTSFAVDSKIPTIIPKQSGAIIGQRNGLSTKDAQKINNMYLC